MSGGAEHFFTMKQTGEPIVMLTCYDYPTALLEEEAGVDIIFVGDSVGTNVLGYESEREVTMDDMLHHVRAVRRGTRSAYLLADMPHMSYHTPASAVRNARVLQSAGADGVKLEGGTEQVDVIRALVHAGFDVCGHIGFTPQTLSRPGQKGRVQGKSVTDAMELLQSAERLEEAGIMMLVLELVTEPVAQIITERTRVPTIGIGAGRFCDGQVLVVTDLLGLSPFTRKLARRYAEWRASGIEAVRQYRNDVKMHAFPTEENAFPANADDVARFKAGLIESAQTRREVTPACTRETSHTE